MGVSKRTRAARRGWSQRGPLVDHIVTVEVDSPGRDGQLRSTTRDIIVPARQGTRKAELLWLAQHRVSDLPRGERYAVGLLRVPGREITIAEGPKTRSKRVKLR